MFEQGFGNKKWNGVGVQPNCPFTENTSIIQVLYDVAIGEVPLELMMPGAIKVGHVTFDSEDSSTREVKGDLLFRFANNCQSFPLNNSVINVSKFKG